MAYRRSCRSHWRWTRYCLRGKQQKKRRAHHSRTFCQRYSAHCSIGQATSKNNKNKTKLIQNSTTRCTTRCRPCVSCKTTDRHHLFCSEKTNVGNCSTVNIDLALSNWKRPNQCHAPAESLTQSQNRSMLHPLSCEKHVFINQAHFWSAMILANKLTVTQSAAVSDNENTSSTGEYEILAVKTQKKRRAAISQN